VTSLITFDTTHYDLADFVDALFRENTEDDVIDLYDAVVSRLSQPTLARIIMSSLVSLYNAHTEVGSVVLASYAAILHDNLGDGLRDAEEMLAELAASDLGG
jgi:hypothetical protein